MSINPVWIREMRARWRGWRAFALLAAYVAILAGVLLWCYNDFQHSWQAQQVADPRLRMALLGHNLFLAMTCLQAGLWMLIAPITSTAITNERERGLMESLHLSQLSARQIVCGKLLSALSFILLLIVVTLPIEAICFLMGGVSPGEVLFALVLHVSIAVLWAALGLAVSAWSLKSLAAMVVAIALSLPGSYVSFAVIPDDFESVYTALFTANGAIAWEVSYWWGVGIIFNSLILLLWIATCGARKVHREPWRIEWSRLRRALQIESTPPPRPKARRRWELGFLARLQFSNPIMGREVRACFRPRSSSTIMVGIAVLLLPFAVLAYGFGLYETFVDANMRHDLCAALSVVYLVVVILLCAVQGAGAFAREREQSTLTALRLSLLSPRELISGKMGAPLLVVAVCGLVFLPFFLLSVRSLRYSPGGTEIALSQMLGAVLVLAASAWCVTLIGLTFSWFNRRVIAAMCWTAGTLFAFLIGAPVLLYSTATPSASWTLDEFFCKWHPAFAMFALFNQLHQAAPASFILFLLGAALLFFLWRGVLAFREVAD